MDFQQIRDFVNPAVAQATGLQEVENLSMHVPVAYVPVQLVIDGALSLTSENPVQNKVIAVAIQNLDGRITAIEGQFSEGVTEAVNNWLAAHPEATTTVQDGAISYAKLDANLKGEVDQISELKSAIFDESESVFSLNNIPNVIKKTNFNSYPISNQTAIKLEPSSTYDSYAYILTESAALYVKPSEMTSTYFSLSYGINYTGTRESSGNIYFDCTNALRLRLSDGNLPTENNRLNLQAGDVIVISITAGASENIYGLTTINSINEDFQNQVLGTLPEDVALLKDETDLIFTEADTKTSLANLPYLYYKTGYNSFATGDGTAVKLEATSGYDSYACVLTEDANIYVDPDEITAAYFSIAYGSDYTSTDEISGNYFMYCTDAQRVRLSENNLPTIDNKLTLHAGDVVSFTITAGNTAYVYGFGQALVVRDEFKADILSKPHLRYVNASGPNSSSERVEIYVPTANGYVRYDFLHTVKNDINADVWRIGYAYHARDDFSEDYALTSTGEWECAIKLSGRSDFSGGFAHGDEIYTGITFLLDGKTVDISDYTDFTPFTNLSVFEQSNLYDPDDGTTAFAVHGSEHCFTADGMTVRQSVKFSSTVTVSTAYLAMLPITKLMSGTVIPDSTFAEVPTSSTIRLYDTEAVTIFKDTKSVKTEFSVPKWEYLSSGDYTFMCTDNGSTEYDKCYFANTLSDVIVSADRLLKTETKYNFIIGV